MRSTLLGFVSIHCVLSSWSFGQCPIRQEAEIVFDRSHLGDLAGTAVALSGERLLVGAPGPHENDTTTGATYVLRRDGPAWVREATLQASDGALGDRFGFSVALSGDSALVGAWHADSEAGVAYVFVRTGTTWQEQAKLVPDDRSAGDLFGYSVAICGDTALVGAYLDEHVGASGSAYVFEREGQSWVQRAKLVGQDTSGPYAFGNAVALGPDTALVGAVTDDDQGPGSGSAYVFVRAGSSWSEQAKLLAGDGEHSDWFGNAVSLSGDTALVAAAGEDEQGPSAGAAYVFVRSGTVWSEQQKLLPVPGAMGADFGYSVSVVDDRAVVGAFRDGGTGAVFVFVSEGGSWSQVERITASDAAPFDGFGGAVALDERRLLVGALGVDRPVDNAGAAYTFTLPLQPEVYCTGKRNSLGCLPQVGFSGCPSSSASAGYALSARSVRNRQVGLFVYSLGERAALPYKGGLLCASPPLYRTPAASSGGNLPPIQDCSGRYRIDMNAFAAGALGGAPRPELRDPGTRYRGQWWSRDLGDPFGISLTDAVESTVGP